MKTQILKVLLVALSLLGIVQVVKAQRYTYTTNGYSNYYLFDDGTASGFSGAGNVVFSPQGTPALPYLNISGNGYCLMSKRQTTAGSVASTYVTSSTYTPLNNNEWEWSLLYKCKDVTQISNVNTSAGIGSNVSGWRYWLHSSSATISSTTTGFYVTQTSDGFLRVYVQNGTSATAQLLASTNALSSNTTYCIKIQRLIGGFWRMYLDPYTSSVQQAQTLQSTTSNSDIQTIPLTYARSVIECQNTTGNDGIFQWDELHMYTRYINFTGITSAANGVTQSPLYNGEGTVILYGMQVNMRGNYDLGGQIYFAKTESNAVGNFVNSLNPTNLYKTSNSVFNTATATISSSTLQVFSGSANAQTANISDSYATSGNYTTGVPSIAGYYFITGTLNSTLSNASGTMSFTGINTGSGLGVYDKSTGNPTVGLTTTAASPASAITFVTASSPAVTTTSPATAVTGTTATIGGTVTNAGAPATTEYGTVYSSSNATPLITTDTKVIKGTTPTVGSAYTTPLSGLTAGITYYFRAYATSSTGTVYGAVVTFTTLPTAPTVPAVSNCGAGPIAITASGAPAGGSYKWYTVASGGTAIAGATGATYTPNLPATDIFYVTTVTASGLESTTRTAVTATIYPVVSSPFANALLSYSFDTQSPANAANTIDVSGTQNDGIPIASPTATTDRFGFANSAYSFNGSTQWFETTTLMIQPQTFTISAWINTTTTKGGVIVGYTNSQNGGGNHDRFIWMDNNGYLNFGLYSSGNHVISSGTTPFNDGQWHHVVATLSSAGAKLFVDNQLLASNATYTAGETTNGYWGIGGGNASGWSPTPTSSFFNGKIDDVAIYSTDLSSSVTSMNDVNQIGQYAPVCTGSPITLYAPTITGATFTWTDTNGNVVNGQSATFASSVATAYSLTATGGPGSCPSPTAYFTPTLYPAPTAAFTAPAGVDINTSATVTISPTSVATGNTYVWNFNGGTPTPTSLTTSGPYSVKWTTYGLKTITLIVNNTSGCSDTTSQVINVSPANTSGNYAFSQPITLNTSSAGISSTLNAFPALVYIKEDALKTGVNCANNIQFTTGGTNGYDFAFTLPGGTTELFYQVENYDPTTGTLLAWVQIPTVTSANTSLTFYFGSKTPAHTAAFTAATWPADYLSVYHYNETPTTGSATVLESTSATTVGTPTNVTQSTDEIHSVTGNINGNGGGYTLNGLTSKIITSKTANISGSFTLSAWVYVTVPTGDNKVVTNELDFKGGYKLSVKSGKIETETRNTNFAGTFGNLGIGGTVSASAWHYIQGTFNTTTGNFLNYLDGAAQSTATTTSSSSTNNIPTGGNIVSIGIDHGSGVSTGIFDGSFFGGNMDEVRISNIQKSADWIKLEYYNQTNPVTFTNSSTAITTNATIAAAIGGSIVYTWTGGSTDPTAASNWKSAASGNPNFAPPYDGFCSLVIPGSLTKYPLLGADVSIYGLTLQSGSSLNLNGHNLNVGCNIYNSSGGQILYGTQPFATDPTTANASIITWNGTGVMTSQTYNGSTTAATAQVGQMIINNATTGGKVTISSGTFDIYSYLGITAGNLAVTSPAVLTLKSNAIQSANVGQIPSANSIAGFVNVERFITGGGLSTNRGYRTLSSPVNQTSTTSSLSNTFNIDYLNGLTFNNITYPGAYTGGLLGTAAGFSVTSVGPTLNIFDERKLSNIKAYSAGKNVGVTRVTTIGATTGPTTGTIDLTNGTTNLNIPVGNAFQMFFIGPSTRSNSSSATLPADATLTAIGYLNQQDVTVNLWFAPTGGVAGQLSYTVLADGYSGFNMVGNPYASTINLATVLSDNASSIDNIYVLKSKGYPNQTYVAYTPSGTSAPSSTPTTAPNGQGYALSGEGFFVHAISTGKALKFKETEKVQVQLTGTALIMSAPKGETLTSNGLGIVPKSFKSLELNNTTTQSSDAALTGFYMKIEQDTAVYNYCGIYFGSAWSKNFQIGDARDLDGSSPLVMMSSFSADGVRSSVKHFPDYRQGARIKLFADGKTDGMYTLRLEGLRNIDTANYKITLLDHYKKDSLDIGRYGSYAFNILKSDTTTSGANRFELVINQQPGSKYQLATFTAQKATGGVLVTWRAYNEGNNYSYTLEKQDPKSNTYNPIYTTQSDGGTIYKYTDKTPNAGNNVYRLKQVDLFGNITYAGPVNIYYDNSGNASMFSLYPNPTAETLNILVTNGKTNNTASTYKLNIYDATGMLVMQKTSSNINWSENVSQFNPGIYIAELKDSNGNSLGKAKFVKK